MVANNDPRPGGDRPRLAVTAFLLEIGLYAVCVAIYGLLVLHFLGRWLKPMFDQQRTLYATVALLLIVGQGAGLELLTNALLRLVRRWIR